jgi:hypothetical protein
MEPRMARMRGVRAPHRRTAHTAHPPIRGCAAGCAVGGANPASPAHRWSPAGGGGVVRQSRRAATAPKDRSFPHTCWGCHVIQRERPQPVPGMSGTVPAGLRAAEGRSRPHRPSSARALHTLAAGVGPSGHTVPGGGSVCAGLAAYANAGDLQGWESGWSSNISQGWRPSSEEHSNGKTRYEGPAGLVLEPQECPA